MFDLRAQLSVSHYFDCYLYLFCFQPGVSFHSNKYSSAKQQQINYQRFTDTGILPDRGPNELWTKGGILYVPPSR